MPDLESEFGGHGNLRSGKGGNRTRIGILIFKYDRKRRDRAGTGSGTYFPSNSAKLEYICAKIMTWNDPFQMAWEMAGNWSF